VAVAKRREPKRTYQISRNTFVPKLEAGITSEDSRKRAARVHLAGEIKRVELARG